MLRSHAGPLPRMHALRAFEAAARHSSFNRAAEELGTHQPTVSRYIAELEHEIGVRLFERSHRTVSLTPAGEVFQRAVAIGLERIAAGARTASSVLEDQRVVVACGPGTSYQFLMPRFQELRRALGDDAGLRILPLDPDMLERLIDDEADLVLAFDDADGAPDDWVTVFGEAVTPVCSPDFAATHARVLERPVAEWSSLPFLRFARPTRGWSTWQDWFESAGYPAQPRYIGIDDYIYLLEAAVDGQGLALGWRYYIDRYLEAGTLVTVVDGFVKPNRSCFARLTKRGRRRPVARRCLDALGALTGEAPRD